MKYLVQLSNKTKIPIDEDELQNVLAGIQAGNPVKVRQGIFNPSFFVTIVEDEDRQPINHFTDGLVERPNLPDIFANLKKLK